MLPVPVAPALLNDPAERARVFTSPPEEARALALPLLDRRTFFKGSLVGAAVLWAGGLAGFTRPARAGTTPATGYLALSPAEVRIATAIANAMFPPGGAIPMSGEEAGTVHVVDEYIYYAGDNGPLLRLLLRIVDVAPLVFFEGGARLSTMSVDDATRALDRWAHSSLYFRHAAMSTLKLMFGMGYFASPDVRAHIGWVDVCPEGGAR